MARKPATSSEEADQSLLESKGLRRKVGIWAAATVIQGLFGQVTRANNEEKNQNTKTTQGGRDVVASSVNERSVAAAQGRLAMCWQRWVPVLGSMPGGAGSSLEARASRSGCEVDGGPEGGQTM